MSELKVYEFDTDYPNDIQSGSYYDKSEADKVIAEKDKEIARLDDLAHAHNIELLRKENLIEELKKKEVLLGKTLNTISESHKHVVSLARKCNHVNYKRCLAMAEKCESMCYWFSARFDHHELVDNVKWELFDRWRLRWAKLADKFKEAH